MAFDAQDAPILIRPSRSRHRPRRVLTATSNPSGAERIKEAAVAIEILDRCRRTTWKSLLPLAQHIPNKDPAAVTRAQTRSTDPQTWVDRHGDAMFRFAMTHLGRREFAALQEDRAE